MAFHNSLGTVILVHKDNTALESELLLFSTHIELFYGCLMAETHLMCRTLHQ